MANLSPQVQALLVDEILDAVFGVLNKASLAACIRVCRNWEPSAARALWRDLRGIKYGLKPLAMLVGEIDPNTKALAFKEDCFFPEKWSRYNYYACLVHKISINIGDGVSPIDQPAGVAHPSLVLRLHAMVDANRACVLPRVTWLNISPYGSDSCERAACLISDGLRTLSSDWGDETPRLLVPILQRILHCPLLESLYLARDPGLDQSQLVMDWMAQALSSIRRIKTVTLPTDIMIAPSIWTALQKLPSLERMSCSDWWADRQVTAERTSHLGLNQGLDALEALHLSLSHLEAAQLFGNRAIAPITSLTLRVFGTTSTASISGLTTAIGASLCALTTITLILDHSTAELDYDVFQPFTQLQHLTCLHVSSDGASQLSDEDFKKLTQSLPDLEELQICPDPSNEAPPACATLLALNYIATHCRRMRKLALRIDVSLTNLPSFSTAITPFSDSFKTISFGLSPVSEVFRVAQHLSRLLLTSQPEYIVYDEGISRSGRSEDSDAELSERYATAKTNWEDVMEEVSKLRPYVDSIRETANVEIALLQVKVKMLEDRIEKMKAGEFVGSENGSGAEDGLWCNVAA